MASLWARGSAYSPILYRGTSICHGEECPCLPCILHATTNVRTNCCECMPEEMIVDMGAGGWTDGSWCDQCNEIAGEYVLTAVYFGGTISYHEYLVNSYCDAGTTTCGMSTVITTFRMQLIYLYIASNCLAYLEVQLQRHLNTGSPTVTSTAIYQLSPFTTAEYRCPGPYTLSRTNNTHTTSGTGCAPWSGNAPCAGTLPATVDIYQG